MSATTYGQDVKVVCLRKIEEAAAVVANRPELAVQYWRDHIVNSEWFDAEKEMIVVLHLNRKNRVRSHTMISVGTATSSLCHPREVYRAAIVRGATAIIVMHNHPSGDPAPSAADIQITRQLCEASKTVEIDLLDHVIVGEAQYDPRTLGYYSFREGGLI